jgi:hypothetical protein
VEDSRASQVSNYAVKTRPRGKTAHELVEKHEEEKPFKKLVLTKESVTPPTFTYNVKIIVGFFQVASCIADLTEIPWPAAYKSFIGFFAFLV